MGVLSFLRKNKQESVPGDNAFQTRAEEQSSAVRGRRKRRQDKSAEEPVDPVLPEKKRARRRLIGAIALVLAAVIGLPMFLDSEPKPLAEDITIQIPSKDKPLPSTGAREAAPPSAGKAAAIAGLDKNEEVIALPGAPAAAPKANPQPPSGTSARPEPKQEHKAEAKVSAQAQQETAKPDEAARARTLPEAKPEPKAEKAKAAFEKKPARYMIQVAALASHEKVNELQGKLKNAGIRSQAQKVATQSGERIRIRVGPFASKEEAEKVRAKLARMGYGGTLVPA
jgi:DedD protein